MCFAGTAQAENLPSSVANPDDILLEKIQFKDEDGESNNKLPLRIIDQVILLAFWFDLLPSQRIRKILRGLEDFSSCVTSGATCFVLIGFGRFCVDWKISYHE